MYRRVKMKISDCEMQVQCLIHVLPLCKEYLKGLISFAHYLSNFQGSLQECDDLGL